MPAMPLSPTDFDLLRDENTRLVEQVSGQQRDIAQLRALVEKLTFQLAMLKRIQFGPKSEASARMDDLFGTPTELEQPTAPPKAPPHKASREPQAAPRVTLPPNLPVDVVRIDLPEADKHDAEGNPLRRTGVVDQVAVGVLEQFGGEAAPGLAQSLCADFTHPSEGVCRYARKASSLVCKLAHRPEIIKAAMRGRVKARCREKARSQRRKRLARSCAERKVLSVFRICSDSRFHHNPIRVNWLRHNAM